MGGAGASIANDRSQCRMRLIASGDRKGVSVEDKESIRRKRPTSTSRCGSLESKSTSLASAYASSAQNPDRAWARVRCNASAPARRDFRASPPPGVAGSAAAARQACCKHAIKEARAC
eukprot:scaffold138008_cov31-Tisochrysis_lutea.AAC.3